MGTIWVARDTKRGDMQYAVFSSEPNHGQRGFQSSGTGCIRIDVRNEIGEQLAGRQLVFRECIEVICSEVID